MDIANFNGDTIQDLVVAIPDTSAATSYRIQIDDSSTFSAPLVVDQTVTVSQFTGPSLAARQHWWRVRGINSAGAAGRATHTAPVAGQVDGGCGG